MRDYASPRGTEGRAQSELAPPPDAARELDVREVGAGDEQYRRDGEDERQLERVNLKLRIDGAVETKGHVPRIVTLCDGNSSRHDLELTVRVRGRRAVAQAHEPDENPSVGRRDGPGPVLSVWEIRRRRNDADDDVRLPVDQNSRTERRFALAKERRDELVADDDGFHVGVLVRGHEGAAEEWPRSDDVKEV